MKKKFKEYLEEFLNENFPLKKPKIRQKSRIYNGKNKIIEIFLFA